MLLAVSCRSGSKSYVVWKWYGYEVADDFVEHDESSLLSSLLEGGQTKVLLHCADTCVSCVITTDEANGPSLDLF